MGDYQAMAHKLDALPTAPFSLRDPSRVIYQAVYDELWRRGQRSDARDFKLRVDGIDFSRESAAKQIVLMAASKYFKLP